MTSEHGVDNKVLMGLVLHALGYGPVSIGVDCNHPDVVLPPQFSGYIVLQYGLNMPKPIPDLVIDVKGILATLSFGNEPYMTFVPWAAVTGLLAENEVPEIDIPELEGIIERASRPMSAVVAAKTPFKLREVKADEVFTALDVEPPREFGGLRLIK